MTAIVEVQHLTASFGALKVLRDISMTVAEGEFMTLIGPSGCGKSTLLRVVSGIIPGMIEARLDGKVSVADRDPTSLPPGFLEVVFQERTLLPWRTALGNVKLGLELIGNSQSSREPETLLDLVGLEKFKDSFPHELSGGMKQRVALASALAIEPQILLMDEPLGALDALTREEMWILLEEIHREKPEMAIILVTHHIEEAVVLGDTIVVMVGHPGVIKKKVGIDIPRPRIGSKGAIAPDCLKLANTIREIIREKKGEKDD